MAAFPHCRRDHICYAIRTVSGLARAYASGETVLRVARIGRRGGRTAAVSDFEGLFALFTLMYGLIVAEISLNWRLALVTSQLFDMAKALGVNAVANTTPADRSTCLPMTTSRARADQLSVWPIGEP